MNQDQQETHDEAKRRVTPPNASDGWVILAVLSKYALPVLVVLSWVGLISTNPLDAINNLIGLTGNTSVFSERPSSFGGLISFMVALASDLSWAWITFPVWIYARYRAGVIEAGSEDAYWQQRHEQSERAATQVAVGKLVGVTIAKAGPASSSATQVETSKGFFVVSGFVGSVKKGAPVFTQNDQLLIGKGQVQKAYLIIS